MRRSLALLAYVLWACLAGLPNCFAQSNDSEAIPVVTADVNDGSIAETAPEAAAPAEPPKPVAPLPASASGGTVPKT